MLVVYLKLALASMSESGAGCWCSCGEESHEQCPGLSFCSCSLDSAGLRVDAKAINRLLERRAEMGFSALPAAGRRMEP